MLLNLLAKLKISYTEEQLNQLEKYYQLLIEWNQKINLTSIITKEEIYQKHFFDSLLLLEKVKFTDETLCDVGTGAGFPGVVIKIFFPKIKLFLVESVTKKCNFLQELVVVLKLQYVTIINDRVENIANSYWEYFDYIVTRAVGKLTMLLELCVPLLKVKGMFIALKANVEKELMESKTALKELNTVLKYTYSSNWSFLGKREILYFMKEKSTKIIYPRHFSKIKNTPL